MTLSETDMERLAFNQYLLKQAREQSRKRQPAASASVLTFHDAVELFFIHSGEYLDAPGAGKGYIKFMEYFDIINKGLSEDRELSQKPAIRRLNTARTSLKHEGTRPQKSDIDSFRQGVQDFFEQNVPKVFDIDLSEISSVNLINDEEVCQKLKEAEKLIQKNETKVAVEKIAIAYSEAFSNYEKRFREKYGYIPYGITSVSGTNRKAGSLSKENYYDDVNKSISSLEQAVKIHSLGMDYRDYSRFDSIIPRVITLSEENIQWSEEDPTISLEDARFCLDFVTELVIELESGEPSSSLSY